MLASDKDIRVSDIGVSDIGVSTHLPRWFRRATLEKRFQSGQYFHEPLIGHLKNQPDITLTVSMKAQDAQDFAKETLCISYHKSFKRRRNPNVKTVRPAAE